MEQQIKVIKKPPPYKPTKFFLSSLNTFTGHQLVAQLRNDNIHPENPNRIVGTLSQKQDLSVPNGVRKVIDKNKVKFTQDIILDSDVIIYDLNTCDLQEAEFAISTLKVAKTEENKILICISSVMTWALTPPKQKKQQQGQDIDDGAGQQPDTEQQGKDDNAQTKKTYVRFTDKDYTLRRPLPEYQKLKSIQTLCLAAGSTRKQLRSYVLCSGILYGNGQRLLQPYFLQARLQKPEQLIYFGQGKNRIPMVHVKDLVTYVKKVIQRPPKVNYLLAIDHNSKPTLKKIVESISIGIGTGKIKKIPVDKQHPNIDMLTLNLRMKPSNCFIKLEQEEAAIEQQQGNQIPKFKFQWQCKQGVQKNIKKLCDQYNKARGFKQMKILLTGPPASGKTYYAKRLSQKYYLPHLHIKQIIQQVKSLQNNQLAQQVNNFLTSQKQKLIQEGTTAFQQRKQKWKKIPKDQRQPLQPFNPNSITPILSDQLVYKCFEWRLSQNDCLNRGYVLDGYPRNYQNAKNIFMSLPPQEEGADQNTVKIINEKALPTKVFVLDASDEELLKRLKNLPQQQLIGSHFNQKDMKRRLKIYRKRNEQNTGVQILQDFFTQNLVQVYHLKLSDHVQKTLQSIIKPILPNQTQNKKFAQLIIKSNKQQVQINRKKYDEKQKLSRDIQLQDYKIKKQNQQNQQREILQRNSLALRKYLDANVVPFLVEGIHQILKQLPENPVDYLAQFLFKMSLKVPNPDPSTFEF